MRSHPPSIRTEDMMHAAFLMSCGAQFLRLEPCGKRYSFILSIEVLDKRAASNRLRHVSDQIAELADDLSGGDNMRTLKDIVEDSFFSNMYDTFKRLSLLVKQARMDS